MDTELILVLFVPATVLIIGFLIFSYLIGGLIIGLAVVGAVIGGVGIFLLYIKLLSLLGVID